MTERFKPDGMGNYESMYAHPEGEYVRYSDYAALEQQLTAAREGDARDARRFRDLCELVEYGELGLCVVGDDEARTQYMDGVEDIPPLMDRLANMAAAHREWKAKRDAARQQEAT